MASSSPDTHTRALPTAWTVQENLDNIAEALEALETYKKKDASKGTPPPLPRSGDALSNTLNATSASRRAIQSRWKRSNNAAKLLQDHGLQPISGRNPIPTKGAWLEGWRSTGTPPKCPDVRKTQDFLTPSPVLQFTYINLAFSPAPDDTVSNLYKVWIAVSLRLTHILITISSVVLHRWTSNSKLQVNSSTHVIHLF